MHILYTYKYNVHKTSTVFTSFDTKRIKKNYETADKKA